MLPAIEWKEDRVIMIDQRKLPVEEVYLEYTDYNEVAEAIEQMVIRGAPAIGVAAAFAVALGIQKVDKVEIIDEEFEKIYSRIEKTRPTARNLFWALERMRNSFVQNRKLTLPELKEKTIQEALAIEKEDVETNKKIGSCGKDLIEDGQAVLTHCNAGALATAGFGTALGVIRTAFAEGRNIKVYAGETRPFLQGARLTVWELVREHIPVVLITDSMAGFLMQKGEIGIVITGADRIARTGDTANKIGTYSLAVLAREHGIPFYVAAPLNTIDFNLEDSSQFPIEERDPQEVREVRGEFITVPDVEVYNPAFDITPARLISAIVTERGILRPPYEVTIDSIKKNSSQ